MSNKVVKFRTKIIYDNQLYLKVSDVAKALGYSKQQDFINANTSLVERISGISCIKETVYNNLLSENEEAFSKQGQIEITRIDTLRSKIDSVMRFQGLDMLFERDLLQMMPEKNGCFALDESILLHDIPSEKRKALQELIQISRLNSNYLNMVEYLNDRDRFDVGKIRKFGMDLQYLVSIDCCGYVIMDAYVVGNGVFCEVTDLGDYAVWNEMYIDENGDKILPFYYYDSQKSEDKKQLINLSKLNVDHDFRDSNIVENMIWCIQNLDVTALEDYEYGVFHYSKGTIDFTMGVELLAKIIKPSSVKTIFIDRLIDLKTLHSITEYDPKKVFKG